MGERGRGVEERIEVRGLGLPYDVGVAGEGDVFGGVQGGSGRGHEVGARGKGNGGWRELKAKVKGALGGARERQE